ncbi:hypothetical protein CALVIDRAFT_462651, partial [Calocera viscosa TUFC12733]
MASWDNREVTNEHLLPYVDSATAPPEVAAALHTLPFERNIFKLIANTSAGFVPLMKLISSLWGPARKLPTTDWQIVILRTAAALDCPYEWDVNAPLARLLDLSEAHFAALRDAGTPLAQHAELFSPVQQLLGKMVDELAHHPRISLPVMQEAKACLSDEEIMEVFFIHGIYGFLARTMNSCRIDFDPPIPGLEDMLAKNFAEVIAK